MILLYDLTNRKLFCACLIQFLSPKMGSLGTGIYQMFHKYKRLLPLNECRLTHHIKVTFLHFGTNFGVNIPKIACLTPACAPKGH